MSGKGSSPRPFSVSQDQFASNWDAIFGPKKVDDSVIDAYNNERLVSKFDKQEFDQYRCYCYNCNKDRKDKSGFPYALTRMIVCPECGNKRCPHSTDHNLTCTGSNDPGQPGSRYQ